MPTSWAVVFLDLDGTLLDQACAETAAAERLLGRFGGLLPHCSAEQIRQRWDELRARHPSHCAPQRRGSALSLHAHRQRLRRMAALLGLEPHSPQTHEALRVWSEAYRAAWRLHEDVLPALHALNRWTLGILTNGCQMLQRQKLAHLAIGQHFQHVIVASEAGHAKPARELFEFACRAAGAPVGRCVHVGDRLVEDALAARAAGMQSAWLHRKGFDPKVSVAQLTSLLELPALLMRGGALAAPGRAAQR